MILETQLERMREMPNYITVRVAMLAEDMEENALNEKGEFDLDVIRPMPDDLKLTEGGLQRLAVAAAHALEEQDEAALKEIEAEARLPRVVDDVECKDIDDLCALGKQYLRNEALYGAQTWYNWRIEQWGTKWNVLEPLAVDAGDLKVASFQTAWDAPSIDLMEDLALRCKAPVWMEWADVDDYHGIHTALSTAQGTLRGMAPRLLEEVEELGVDMFDGHPDVYATVTDRPQWDTGAIATVLDALKDFKYF